MKTKSKYCGAALSLFSILALVSCAGTPSSTPSLSSLPSSSAPSSSPESSSEKPSLPQSSIAVPDSSVDSSSSDSSVAPEWSQEDIASAVFSSLPDTPVGETLDLSAYVTFKTKDGAVVPAASVKEFTVEQDMDNDTAYILTDEEEPFLVVGQNIGTATIDLSLVGAEGKTVRATARLAVVASDKLTSLSKSLEGLSDNYTIQFGVYDAARTEDYYFTGTEGQVILSDGKLYDFTADDIDGSGFSVHAGAAAENGKEALAAALPALSIDPDDIYYEPSFAEANGTQYVIEDVDTVGTLMANIGLSSYLELSDGVYYAYGFGINQVAEDQVSLTLFLLDIYGYTLSWIEDPFVLSDIGTTSLPYVDDYIASGKIPTSNSGSMADRFASIAEGMNYTVSASGVFQDPETGKAIETEDLPQYATLKDFYDASMAERLFLFTENGEYGDYYMYDSYEGYSHSTFGYFNHADGYVCTFSMEDGKAVIGSVDYDWYTGQPTPAPFYDTYGANLSNITAEVVEKANLTQDETDPAVFHYAYSRDGGKGGYYFDESLVMMLFDFLYPDVTALYLDDSEGTPMAEGITGDLTLEEDGGIGFVFTLPTPIDESNTVDLVITGSVGDVGSTVINGLSDILDAEPEESGGGWWGW